MPTGLDETIAQDRVASNERTANDRVAQTNDGPTDPELIRFLREELGGDVSPDETVWEHAGPIWLWRGEGKDGQPSFLTIDGYLAEAIRVASSGHSAAWGSVYVEAAISKTCWRTSVFPSKARQGYMLPIKASVRKAEKLAEGDLITVRITLSKGPSR
ncbi:DUF1905 domain-containing protein [Sphingobium yanoikuyae]|uniref:DUF1905 domain-containing protein n=1 Tax=Sphingobium yanoikuyae TaxID=13690 RepID=UPI0035C708A3